MADSMHRAQPALEQVKRKRGLALQHSLQNPVLAVGTLSYLGSRVSSVRFYNGEPTPVSNLNLSPLTPCPRAQVPGAYQCLRLVTMFDDGEQEPHEAEQCGVFLHAQAVRDYVAARFTPDMPLAAEPYGDPDDLTWNLRYRNDKSGGETDLVLLVWRETLFL